MKSSSDKALSKLANWVRASAPAPVLVAAPAAATISMVTTIIPWFKIGRAGYNPFGILGLAKSLAFTPVAVVGAGLLVLLAVLTVAVVLAAVSQRPALAATLVGGHGAIMAMITWPLLMLANDAATVGLGAASAVAAIELVVAGYGMLAVR